MATSRLAIVQSIYADWARGDFTGTPEAFHPDIHFESFMPDSAQRVVTTGIGGIARFLGDFLPAWRDYRLVGERFEEIDEAAMRAAG